MIKAVIFDLFETLVTQYDRDFYKRIQIEDITTLPRETFLREWSATAHDRHKGVYKTRREVFDMICRDHGGRLITEKYDAYISWVDSRKQKAFDDLDPNLLSLLDILGERGIKRGMITDCEPFEIDFFERSNLSRRIDVPLFSCREGLAKPDREIYHRTVERLGCLPGECLYLGDGGSSELQGAREAGLVAYQAWWFIKVFDKAFRNKADKPFKKISDPLDLLSLLDEG